MLRKNLIVKTIVDMWHYLRGQAIPDVLSLLDYKCKQRDKTSLKLQKEQMCCFKSLSPESYDLFFKALRDGTYKDFKSELEAKSEV